MTDVPKKRGRPPKVKIVPPETEQPTHKLVTHQRPTKYKKKPDKTALQQVDAMLDLTKVKTGRPTLEEHEEKQEFRREARKYAPQMLLNLVEIALHSEHAASRTKASEAIIYLGHGRPSTVQSEVPPTQLVPNFTIVFNNERPDPPKLTLETPFTVND